MSVATCNGVRYTCTKGAPKAVLQLMNCSKDTTAKMYTEKATEYAGCGFRALGVAIKKEDEEWSLLGMLPMFDLP